MLLISVTFVVSEGLKSRFTKLSHFSNIPIMLVTSAVFKLPARKPARRLQPLNIRLMSVTLPVSRLLISRLSKLLQSLNI